jgi:hypothetical protein
MKRLGHLLMVMLVLAGGAKAEWIFRDASGSLPSAPLNATAVAWGDVDNDGDPDLFVAGGSDAGVLYLNNGGRMTEADSAYGLTTLNTHDVYSARFVDFDGDGYLDLFLLTDDGHGFRLYRQLSNHRFQTVQNNVGLEFAGRITSAAWLDLDHDGRLDLILSNSSRAASAPVIIESREFELVEKRDSDFLHGSGAVGAIAVEDYDRDGDEDIFLGGSNSEPARLLRRQGASYLNWSESFGIPPSAGRTGAVWFDYNNDQQFDLYAPGDPESNCLMRGTAVFGTHGLVPVTETEAVPPASAGQGYAHAVDANMDGWTDLFVYGPHVPGCQLFENVQGAAWRDVTRDVGLDLPLPLSACAWADWDGDGDLDLALALGARGLSLFRNDTEHRQEFVIVNPVAWPASALLQGCTAWMQFEQAKALGSTHMNTAAPGGDFTRVLLVNSSHYKSAEGCLMVRWPNGMESRYPLSELQLDTTVTLLQPLSPPVIQTMTADEPLRCVHLAVIPNPFNPITTLTYALPEAAEVELKVFNLTGQEVATLASGPQAAGTYRVPFDGSRLPSGLYLSRLTAGGHSEISRLLLVK